tara:strand:- start:403 stop:522 length:120 start_codon:yes stop_codon:yes gene_type:complete
MLAKKEKLMKIGSNEEEHSPASSSPVLSEEDTHYSSTSV